MTSVHRVFGECALAVGKGIERAKEGGTGLQLDDDAAEFWSKRYIKSIRNALKKRQDWPTSRRAALLMAERLGMHAARAAQKAGSRSIQRTHAESASADIEADKRCTSQAAGSGRYCEIALDPEGTL
jgi:hypothetical protein